MNNIIGRINNFLLKQEKVYFQPNKGERPPKDVILGRGPKGGWYYRVSSSLKTNKEIAAIKTYGIAKRLTPYQGSYILEDGKMLDLDDEGHRALGINEFGRKTGALRIRVTPNELNVDFFIDHPPSESQLNTIKNESLSRKITFSAIDKEDEEMYHSIGIRFPDLINSLKKIYKKV